MLFHVHYGQLRKNWWLTGALENSNTPAPLFSCVGVNYLVALCWMSDTSSSRMVRCPAFLPRCLHQAELYLLQPCSELRFGSSRRFWYGDVLTHCSWHGWVRCSTEHGNFKKPVILHRYSRSDNLPRGSCHWFITVHFNSVLCGYVSLSPELTVNCRTSIVDFVHQLW